MEKNERVTSSSMTTEQTEDNTKTQETKEQHESLKRDSFVPKKNEHARQIVDESIAPKDDKFEPFANELRTKGLSPSHWIKLFKNHGIESTEQLEHIDQTTINKLSSFSKHSWEKEALYKLYKKNSEDDAVKQEAIRIIENLHKKHPDTQQFISDDLKANDDRRKTVLDDKSWLKEFELEKIRERLNKEKIGQELVERKQIRSCDVIRKISAGQLLRGQLFHKNLEESSIYRHKLIEVDNCIGLLSPGISETMEIIEFNDKKQSDEFDSVLKQSGKSFAIALFKGIPFISGAQGHFFTGKTDNEEEKTTTNKQELFVEISQILNVPMASFTLSHENVKLSECAMEALKRLHYTFTLKREATTEFERECKLFFYKFGSHYYTGMCHFGGRYIWKVTCTASSNENRSENYNTTKLALNGSLSGGFKWFGGEISGAKEDKTEKTKKKRTYSEKSKVTKKLEKFGGPQEVDDISLWKKGLAEYNDTWVIIDKDVSQTCYEGVWKLIQGNNEFSGAELFSRKIQLEWQKLYSNDDKMSWSRSQIFLDCGLETIQSDDVDGCEENQTDTPKTKSKMSGIDSTDNEKYQEVINELKSTLHDFQTGKTKMKRAIDNVDQE